MYLFGLVFILYFLDWHNNFMRFCETCRLIMLFISVSFFLSFRAIFFQEALTLHVKQAFMLSDKSGWTWKQ